MRLQAPRVTAAIEANLRARWSRLLRRDRPALCRPVALEVGAAHLPLVCRGGDGHFYTESGLTVGLVRRLSEKLVVRIAHVVMVLWAWTVAWMQYIPWGCLSAGDAHAKAGRLEQAVCLKQMCRAAGRAVWLQLQGCHVPVYVFAGQVRGCSRSHVTKNNLGAHLVDPASSDMLVSKIKPCMSQYMLSNGETATGSLKQL